MGGTIRFLKAVMTVLLALSCSLCRSVHGGIYLGLPFLSTDFVIDGHSYSQSYSVLVCNYSASPLLTQAHHPSVSVWM